MLAHPRYNSHGICLRTHGISPSHRKKSGFYKRDEVLRFAKKFDLPKLNVLADEANTYIDASKPENGDWSPHMPTWKTKGRKRGLLAWGETRQKDEDTGVWVVVQKKGCLPQIRRAAMMCSLEDYFEDVGAPPVEAGDRALFFGIIF